MTKRLALPIICVLVCACGRDAPEPAAPATAPAPVVEAPNPWAGVTAYAGATVWDGSGSRPQSDAVLMVRDGRVLEIRSGEAPQGAETVDLRGSWIVPGFINAHAHVSGRWAPDGLTDAAARVEADLALFARYGVTTLLSLGGEPPEAIRVRDRRDDIDLRHARLYLAGPLVSDADAPAASSAARENVALGVDWIKVRIDDNLGRGSKMPWEAAQAVFDVARVAGTPVATHIFYMDDAVRVLDMGSSLIAHSVRDQRVTDEFVARLLASGVCYVPTLTREISTFVYAERPDFFDDPFFLEAASRSEMARVSEPAFMSEMASSASAAAYRKALAQAEENLRILIGSGVPVAFGTDSGPPARFPGYFEHIELYLMVDAGLTPREALLSATSVAADCLGLEDVGTLAAGRWADFVVLAEDPLQDIRATRSIRHVYVAGNRVARD